VDQAAGRAVLAVERLLGHMGISLAFDDYGISRDDVPRMAARAAKQARLLGMNTRAIGENDITAIFRRGFR
jgi:alcohol dehydrogenase